MQGADVRRLKGVVRRGVSVIAIDDPGTGEPVRDYEATSRKRIDLKFDTALSAAGHHIAWIVGADTPVQALDLLNGFPLDCVAQNMRCPCLPLQRRGRRPGPYEGRTGAVRRCGFGGQDVSVFTVEEGGTQHT